MSPEVVPFERSAEGGPDDNNRLDKAGQTILQLLSKAADVAEQNSRHATRRNSLRTKSAQPKIGFPSLRPKSLHTGSKQSALRSGSIASTPKLRIDFCDRVAINAAGHNGRREQNGANCRPPRQCPNFFRGSYSTLMLAFTRQRGGLQSFDIVFVDDANLGPIVLVPLPELLPHLGNGAAIESDGLDHGHVVPQALPVPACRSTCQRGAAFQTGS